MHADQPSEGMKKKKGSEHVPSVAAAVKGEVAALSDSALFLFGQALLQRCSCLEAGDEAQAHFWWWKRSGRCEGCLMVGCDHGPQAEVAQGVGPGPLVER